MLLPKREQEFFLQTSLMSQDRDSRQSILLLGLLDFLPDLFYCYSEKDTHTHFSNQRYNEKDWFQKAGEVRAQAQSLIWNFPAGQMKAVESRVETTPFT